MGEEDRDEEDGPEEEAAAVRSAATARSGSETRERARRRAWTSSMKSWKWTRRV